ncbi:MAG: nucleotidyltransferase family protein [Chromatiaceae bacterium]|jgi:hypothetical protein|nr:nucleotidyltransferase family protein [Chromatiaceae bacterium]
MSRLDSFLFLCRCLAPNDADSVLVTEIRSGRLSWEQVVAIASGHLVTPILYWSLEKKGLLGELPEELCSYLEAIFDLNRQRNQQILDQLVEVAALLNTLGVEIVLLKGAASLAADLYGDMGVRCLSDLDLLVPQDALKDCVCALEADGYSSLDPKLFG